MKTQSYKFVNRDKRGSFMDNSKLSHSDKISEKNSLKQIEKKPASCLGCCLLTHENVYTIRPFNSSESSLKSKINGLVGKLCQICQTSLEENNQIGDWNEINLIIKTMAFQGDPIKLLFGKRDSDVSFILKENVIDYNHFNFEDCQRNMSMHGSNCIIM